MTDEEHLHDHPIDEQIPEHNEELMEEEPIEDPFPEPMPMLGLPFAVLPEITHPAAQNIATPLG